MARRDRMAAMAAVLSRTGAGQAERLLELFQGDVAPRLAALERCRRQHRLGYVVALTGMLGGIFALFLLAEPAGRDLRRRARAGDRVCGMQWAQRSYADRVRRAVMPAVCGAIGDVSHNVGTAPDLDLERLAQIGLVPRHHRQRIDDVFRGRHRDTGFTMAEVRLRRRGRGRRRSSARSSAAWSSRSRCRARCRPGS